MPEDPSGRHVMLARIGDAVGRVVAEHVGRGPTSIRTTMQGDVVVCIMRDTFTKSERKLVEGGDGAFVKDMRLRFQQTMRDELVAIVTEATGQQVDAFLSDHQIEPDVAAEVFVLAPA